MESVGEAGEETEGDEVGKDKGKKERQGGVAPEGAGGGFGSSGGFESHGGGVSGSFAVEEFAREELRSKDDEKAEYGERDADEAGF